MLLFQHLISVKKNFSLRLLVLLNILCNTIRLGEKFFLGSLPIEDLFSFSGKLLGILGNFVSFFRIFRVRAASKVPDSLSRIASFYCNIHFGNVTLRPDSVHSSP